MPGKVEGVTSDALKTLAAEEELLIAQGVRALMAFYSAPAGSAGESQRTEADSAIREAGKKAAGVRSRRAGLKVIVAEALDYKADFLMWIAAL